MMNKDEEPSEFKNVFSAWKKRDSTGDSNSDIVRIGSGVKKVGTSIRSFGNAGAKKFGDGAKKLTSVVDDGAKFVTDTTKKVAGSTVKITADGAKKLTSVVTGKSTNNINNNRHHYRYEESEEIVFNPVGEPKEIKAFTDSLENGNHEHKMSRDPSRFSGSERSQHSSSSTHSNFAPIANQSQADVQAKIAARYRTQPKTDLKTAQPERKRSVVDRYMPGGDKPSDPETPTAGTENVPKPPPPPPPDNADGGEDSDGKKQPVLVLSPHMTAKLQARMSPKLKPPTRVNSTSLQDRIKLFSSSNASAPSWAINANKKRVVPQLPVTEERKKVEEDKSKWRHELRKQRQPNKSVVPAKFQNVTAAPLKLDNFVPPSFPKDAIDVETITNSIKSNFLFEHLSKADLETLVQAFEKVRVHMGEEVIKQGESGDYFYIIGKGQVQFLVNDKVVGSAGAGKSFGELALLYTSPRAATVIADSNPTYLYRVDQKSFRYIMQTKALETEGEKMNLLKSIDSLKDFDKVDLERLCDCMVLRKFKPNEYIVTKGEEGNAFYILKEGIVKVTDIEAGGNKFDDVTLRPGGYFGERALITSEPRAANVVGQTDGSCFVIDRQTFEKVLGKFGKIIAKAQDKVLLVRTIICHF